MEKMNEARKAALLQKKITWRGIIMSKQDWLVKLHNLEALIHTNKFPKYIYNRKKFNRMNDKEQRAYEEKIKIKMPYAVQLPDGSYFEITKTEAEYFTRIRTYTNIRG